MSDRCDACRREYRAIYSVPNEVWSLIAPRPATLGPHLEHQGGGLLCPDCASDAASAVGIKLCFVAEVMEGS